MNCIYRRFFGIDVIPDDGPELSPHWAGERTEPVVLACAGRRLLWRLIRNKAHRTFFGSGKNYVIPVDKSATRQIRWATGCRVGPFREFQTVIRLLSHGETTAATVYLIGRNTEELQKIEQNVRATFPGLRIVGRAVFHPMTIASVTTAIKKASPRLVLSGVVTNSFLRWLMTSAHRIGPTMTVVAPMALSKMAGRRSRLPVASVITFPVRLLLPVALIIHRIRLARTGEKTAPS